MQQPAPARPVKRKSAPLIPTLGYVGIFCCIATVTLIFFPPGQDDAEAQERAALQQCVQLYSDPQFNDLTFGMTEEKQLCRESLPRFRNMVQTEYSITGSALHLVDSTHSLSGLAIARSRLARDRRAAPELYALALFSDEKLVATLQFGDSARADKAYREISDAIATTQMLQVLAGVTSK
jgi:hypothetical protein